MNNCDNCHFCVMTWGLYLCAMLKHIIRTPIEEGKFCKLYRRKIKGVDYDAMIQD